LSKRKGFTSRSLGLGLSETLRPEGKLNITQERIEQTKIFKRTGYFGGGSAPVFWSENWRQYGYVHL